MVSILVFMSRTGAGELVLLNPASLVRPVSRAGLVGPSNAVHEY